MMAHRKAYLSILAVLICASRLVAQHPVSAPRSDGRQTPLMVYDAHRDATSTPFAQCAPLAAISHGAGGSENGYRYLAEAMAAAGFTTIVMGHRESGLDSLRHDMRQYGLMQGVTALVTDPRAEADRLLDVGAALAWSDSQCKAPFRVLLGHSMGAETVMLEAGAANLLQIASPPAGQRRFDAYVALSPEGPGVVFPQQAWAGIDAPVLVMTGTRDETIRGGGGPSARQIPWQRMPGTSGKCQWLGVIDGATHMDFAGNGATAAQAEPIITSTIAAFLRGARGGACTLPTPVQRLSLRAK